MDNFTQKYNIDRKAASKLLKVSVRTVDRYIKKKVLTAQSVGGRIWLNKEDVVKLGTGKAINGQFQANSYESEASQPVFYEPSTSDTPVYQSTPSMSIDILGDSSTEENEEMSTSETFKNVKSASGSQFYKKLYEETREELKEKQERLEIANYRVGQLEAQLKNSIPLLEYHRESSEKKLEKARMIEKLEQADSTIKIISHKLKFEKYNKKVLFTVLLIILALQPIWLLILSK
ncbi:MAG TPA: helix-turn-helix domain-containing protein [Candidatus Gracilibacteria bacterium]|nr:helix-turn-helix domain-containing protein [Candidatus Gracilibacteria bacterium]